MEEDDYNKPLLSNTTSSGNQKDVARLNPSDVEEVDRDIEEIKNVGDFFREFCNESRKLWHLAAPSIPAKIFEFTLLSLTRIFSGHVSTSQLAAVSMEASVFSALGGGLLIGMAGAPETLCGQAYGAKQLHMLGIYLQKSWILLNATAIGVAVYFALATQILRLLGQDPEISVEAGKFAVMCIPYMFAYAICMPVTKFLQAQSRIIEMTAVTGMAVCLHAFFGWLLMLKLKWGLFGAALVLNSSWWFIAIGFLWLAVSGYCGNAWNGFSWKAFANLSQFLKLSISSTVMFSLELWYGMAMTLAAGYLPNPQLSVATLSICRNITGWIGMVGFGFHVAISVRVSHKLGSGQPRAAKFAIVVVSITSFLVGLALALILFFQRKQFPAIFTDNTEIQLQLQQLTPLLGAAVSFYCLQAALCGVAMGAGWQNFVACIIAACNFIIGLPVSVLLGFNFDMGVKGIWCGMVLGLFLQALALLFIACTRNWIMEAAIVEARLKH